MVVELFGSKTVLQFGLKLLLSEIIGLFFSVDKRFLIFGNLASNVVTQSQTETHHNFIPRSWSRHVYDCRTIWDLN